MSLAEPRRRETLISHPADDARSVPAEHRHALGITDGLVRSQRVEDIEDLREDLGQALTRCKGARFSICSSMSISTWSASPRPTATGRTRSSSWPSSLKPGWSSGSCPATRCCLQRGPSQPRPARARVMLSCRYRRGGRRCRELRPGRARHARVIHLSATDRRWARWVNPTHVAREGFFEHHGERWFSRASCRSSARCAVCRRCSGDAVPPFALYNAGAMVWSDCAQGRLLSATFPS
jgi:hypothetical protein